MTKTIKIVKQPLKEKPTKHEIHLKNGSKIICLAAVLGCDLRGRREND